MANTPDVDNRDGDIQTNGTPLAIDPWRSLAVHFGMLLGVDDFRAVDAYHRGKQWLHSGWLHREGVIWGLRPELAADRGELRIEPGLALDLAGRELHLERPACIDLGNWFTRRAAQLFKNNHATRSPDGRTATLDAHVRARFVGCLDRQVPAMIEPCEGAGRITAYSRVFETVELELTGEPLAPVPTLYPRLRVFVGVDLPRNRGGVPLPEDLDIVKARADILAQPAITRPHSFAAAFRRYSALDAAELTPPTAEAGVSAPGVGVLAAIDPAWLVLAELRELKFRRGPDADDGSETWIYKRHTTLEWTRRPTHVAATPLLDLVAAGLACGAQPDPATPPARGPRVRRDPAIDRGRKTITLEFDKPIAKGSEADQLELHAFVPTGASSTRPAAGWHAIAVTHVQLAPEGTHLKASFAALPAGASVLRLRFGHREPPVLGVDGWPLSGALDDPPAPPHEARPFIHHEILGSDR